GPGTLRRVERSGGPRGLQDADATRCRAHGAVHARRQPRDARGGGRVLLAGGPAESESRQARSTETVHLRRIARARRVSARAEWTRDRRHVDIPALYSKDRMRGRRRRASTQSIVCAAAAIADGG